MDEILYEIGQHSAGLNCGRWDYIFSIIKKFIKYPQFVMGDRANVGMTAPMMDAYVRLLIKTCHKRGVHAMGGMAAQIPISDNTKTNEVAMNKVRMDKLREVMAGHDGTWVAHPGLIPITLEIWNKHMPGPNQIATQKREDVHVTEKDLLSIPHSIPITLHGVETNIKVTLLYLEAWLRGNGCIPIDHLMEDLATAEISRSQLYQWVKHSSKLDNGTTITHHLVTDILNRVSSDLVQSSKSQEQRKSLQKAHQIVSQLVSGEFVDFMSLVAYPEICINSNQKAKL